MTIQYGGFIGYVISVIYAFKFWGIWYGFLNILVPFSFLWDLAIFIGTN